MRLSHHSVVYVVASDGISEMTMSQLANSYRGGTEPEDVQIFTDRAEAEHTWVVTNELGFINNILLNANLGIHELRVVLGAILRSGVLPDEIVRRITAHLNGVD